MVKNIKNIILILGILVFFKANPIFAWNYCLNGDVNSNGCNIPLTVTSDSSIVSSNSDGHVNLGFGSDLGLTYPTGSKQTNNANIGFGKNLGLTLPTGSNNSNSMYLGFSDAFTVNLADSLIIDPVIDESNYIVYTGQGIEQDKTQFGYKRIITCGQSLEKKYTGNFDCRIFSYKNGVANSHGNFQFSIRAMQGADSSSLVDIIQKDGSSGLICVKNTTSCYSVNNTSGMISKVTLPSLPISNVDYFNGQSIYVKADKTLNLSSSIVTTSNNPIVIANGTNFIIIDNNQLKVYNNQFQVITSRDTVMAKEYLKTISKGVFIYNKSSKNFLKVTSDGHVQDITFGKEITSKIGQTSIGGKDNLVFCNITDCYVLEQDTNLVKGKEGLLPSSSTTYKTPLYTVDDGGKSKVLVFTNNYTIGDPGTVSNLSQLAATKTSGTVTWTYSADPTLIQGFNVYVNGDLKSTVGVPPKILAPRDGLVGEWLLKGNANDTSGNGYNGTPSANITFNGDYAHFDGSSNIRLPSGINIQGNNARSLSFSVKPASMAGDCPIGMGVHSGRHNSWGFCYNNDTFWVPRYYDDVYKSSHLLDIGNWYNVTITYDGITTHLFVNGAEINGLNNATGQGNNTPSVISYLGTLPGFWNFTGDLKNVRLYNRALTTQEVTDIYSNILNPISASDPVTVTAKIKGLDANTTYPIKVTAFNEKGDGALVGIDISTNNLPDNDGSSSEAAADSCLDIKTRFSDKTSGMYWIKPNGTAIQTYCDMTTDGGGWTQIALATNNSASWNLYSTPNSSYSDSTNFGIPMSYFSQTGDGEDVQIMIKLDDVQKGPIYKGVNYRAWNPTMDGSVFDTSFDYKSIGGSWQTCTTNLFHANYARNWSISSGDAGCGGYNNGGGLIVHGSSSEELYYVYGLNQYAGFNGWSKLKIFVK